MDYSTKPGVVLGTLEERPIVRTRPHASHAPLTKEEHARRWRKFLKGIRDCQGIKAAGANAQLSPGTISYYLARRPEYVAQYEQAQRAAANVWADKAVEAATSVTDPEMAQLARLAFDAFKWRAAVQDPKRWNDKVRNELNVTIDARSLHFDELRSRSMPLAHVATVDAQEIEGSTETLSVPQNATVGQLVGGNNSQGSEGIE